MLALAALAVGATLLTAPAAEAADRGTGFGTWAPLSSTGWHGSMRVGDVHTYCIHPGLPLATGTTTDHGVSSDANGLSPQQLVSINYLVTTYGQTGDPVQAASVGWAVKAIADRETTLHSWGYRGDSLSEAIDFIMRRASPDNSVAIQQRAERYLAEAAAVRVPRVGGTLTLSTDSDDPTRGAVVADIDAEATGVLRLENAVFADTGSTERTDVRPGQSYAIVAPRATDGRPYLVRARGSFSVRAAAIRYFSTPGQQESAGPAEPARFEISAEDAQPRPVQFSPRISTVARLAGGRFVDEVAFSVGDGLWPRRADGSFVPILATADVYRTGAYPAESDEIPAGLEPVARLTVTTDPHTGAGTYTATTGTLPGPGVYTAVWHIDRAEQDAAAAAHLPKGFVWRERFASPAQTEQFTPPPPPESPTPAPSPSPSLTPTPSTTPSSDAPAPSPTPAALAATGATDRAVVPASVLAVVGVLLGAAILLVRRRRTPSA